MISTWREHQWCYLWYWVAALCVSKKTINSNTTINILYVLLFHYMFLCTYKNHLLPTNIQLI